MKIIFMGTPALAVSSLDALRTDHEIVAVVTQPDKPARREKTLTPPPVKIRALELGIPVLQPARARDESFVEQLQEYSADAIAVVAYGQILPRAILDLPQHGCVNLHFSLLPKWRGAAPVQYAIWNGDTQTGVTTQWMAEQLDAGDIIVQERVDIEPKETAAELFARLTPMGARVLRDTFQLIENGSAPRVPQDETLATFAPTIKKEQGQICWEDGAQEIFNQIRALNPWPVAWCQWNDSTLKIWRARLGESSSSEKPGVIIECKDRVRLATGAGVLELVEVQAAGRPKMPATDWARGARLEAGQTLS